MTCSSLIACLGEFLLKLGHDLEEVADEAVVVATEPFHRDDADRPGPDGALAPEARRDRRGRMCPERLEVERRREAVERRRPVLCETEPAELDGREPIVTLRLLLYCDAGTLFLRTLSSTPLTKIRNALPGS